MDVQLQRLSYFLCIILCIGLADGNPVLGLAQPDTLLGTGLGLVQPVLDTVVGTTTRPAPQPSFRDSRSRSVGVAEPEAKKDGGISGFLGLANLLNPIVRLKKLPPGEESEGELDCTRTYYMGPYTKDITFSANGSVGARKDRMCKWNFIGTEPCIPILTCDTLDLLNEDGKCLDVLEVRDGSFGSEKFCGKIGPNGISAHGGLRDLYLIYRANGPESGDITKLSCTVTCSNRYTGTPLKQFFQPTINSFCKCGKRPNHDFIVNGENATKQEFPWMAALVKAKTRQPFCGASIINDRSLITAAHCFKGAFLQISNVEILLGGHQLDVTPNLAAYINSTSKPTGPAYDEATLKALDSGNGSIRFEIDEVTIHPLYVSQTNDYDVAVIRLSTPIDFHKYPQLSPVCLPKLGSYLRTYANKTAIVAGWGLGGAEAIGTNSILQKLNVTIYTPKECKDLYAHRVNRRMMCAGYMEGGRDSCMGDSGGPLVLQESPHIWHQVGSVSWGEGCAQSKNPGAYIRMTEVGQWIHHQSNINNAVWCEVPTPNKWKSALA